MKIPNIKLQNISTFTGKINPVFFGKLKPLPHDIFIRTTKTVIPENTKIVPSPKNYNVEDNYETLDKSKAEEPNKLWKIVGYYNSPYLPNSDVEQIYLKKDTTFVRAFDDKTSKMRGNWLMKKDDIVGLSAEQIKDKFSLPCKPIYIADVTIQKGSLLRKGICNPLNGWGNGGGIQFELLTLKKGVFDNKRLISEIE